CLRSRGFFHCELNEHVKVDRDPGLSQNPSRVTCWGFFFSGTSKKYQWRRGIYLLLGYWVEYDNHFYYLSGRPVIASCITGISGTSDRAIYGGHERHVGSFGLIEVIVKN
ncbi:hypothetical protein, partial [Thalassolituus maritimus]|uniref:hypothetical protein n=4 Tax=Thalassolituus TaxID=187492 RepID=UPI0026EA3B2A